ncbi:hypothetical protein H1D32_02880 [Anaerobacillus sp. CMMVII]|uniref:hypothetical protein n=1 Tax=Anaerobacillus sp. CMMVII TaxID=2755588 RepID=UPI0021B7E572|nr:hypothetical protein [Anaerobacillus sp. CMMVII]MCT8136794.1 hypothetical protein [Anaerobacillus sp. CMMVII]
MESQSQVKSFVIRVQTVEDDNQSRDQSLRIKVKHVQSDEEATYATLEEVFDYIKDVIGE